MSKIEITENVYDGGIMFHKGTQHEYIGTEHVKEGCSCNGTLKEYDAYVVLNSNVKCRIPLNKANIVNECQNT